MASQVTVGDFLRPLILLRRIAKIQDQLALQFPGRFDLSSELLMYHDVSQLRPTVGELKFSSKYLVCSMLLSENQF